MGKIQPKTIEEAMDLIYNILKQGDTRYNDTEAEDTLASFLINQAVSVEETDFPEIEESREGDLVKHFVQGQEKYIAKVLLKMNGFKDSEIFFERRFNGSAPDVFAEREKSTVLVECCSCRVSKIIDFLSKTDEVWILTLGENPWEEKPLFKKMQWFIFRKGPNWNDIYSDFRRKKTDELRKVKSPIDGL